ncbi:Glutathione S-transferase DHAR3, chloroplastic, partial [Mucuna pruriens]
MSTVRVQVSACALSATVNRLRPNAVVSFNNHFGFRPLRKKPLIVSMSSVPPSQPFEVAVKASVTTPNRIGPFCQRVLLTLEEKHLPYDPKLVDLTNKPEWFVKVNPDGKVPVIKFDEKWVPDSDFITQTLEEKYPSPPLVTPPEKATVGSKIFSTFIGFLQSKDPNDGTEQALLSELSAFNDYIKENGPFINGNEISAADLSLGPKLYHLEIALGHYKKWTVPDSLTSFKSYTKAIFSRESFTKTSAQPEDVIEGWRPKMILEAVEALNEGNGSNKSSISKYIESTYGGLPQGHKVLLNVHLAKLRDSGVLLFWKNNYAKRNPNAPPRRGRGRPPKPKEPLPLNTILSPPRPRGRPRKGPNDPPSRTPKVKASAGSGRPRGRPRKMARPAGGLGEAPPSTVKAGASGRPRGRPPKCCLHVLLGSMLEK